MGVRNLTAPDGIMDAMWPLIVLLLAAGSFVPAEIEQDGIRVRVSVKSHIYTWEVTNVAAPPITTFEIAVHKSYDYHAPPGWTVERSRERFRAWTDDRDSAIRVNRSKSFSSRVSSLGAVLGQLPLTLGFDPDSTEPVTFDAVWGPVRKPVSLAVLVAGTIVMIAGVHTLVLWRRAHR